MLLALWCFVVAFAGGLVGLVLGNIRLPLVVLVATTPAAGAGANIGISGVAAGTATVAHIRARRVNWRLFGWMAPPSIVGAFVGGILSGRLPANALLALIGVTLLYFGFDLLHPKHLEVPPAGRELDVRAAVVSGALIGVLGGLVGLILGALRMPALLRYVGETPTKAIGTNMAVGFCVGIAGLVGHLAGGIDWTAFWIGSLASVPGALLGARMTGFLSPRALMRSVAAVLLVAGVAMLVQAAF